MKIYLYALLIVAATYICNAYGGWAYIHVPIFDVFMHLLGGVGIALAWIAILRSFNKAEPGLMWKVVLGVLFAGLVWETFEIVYDMAGYELWTTNYYIDTLKDLLDDILGGIIAVRLVVQLSHDKSPRN